MRKILSLVFITITYLTMASERADHSAWDELLSKHVSNQGKVNYKGFNSEGKKLYSYLIELKNHAPAEDWTKAEQMAYYINLYNAYTIKFILTKYPVSTPKDVRFSGKDMWNTKLVKTGTHIYTLNYIENSILRPMKDARIHFAINCAAVSCPKLLNKAFTSENLEANLTLLTRTFINHTTYNDISAKKVKLSQIFEWYAQDFKTAKTSLIDFLNTYSDIKINTDAKIEYIPYNWTLNE